MKQMTFILLILILAGCGQAAEPITSLPAAAATAVATSAPAATEAEAATAEPTRTVMAAVGLAEQVSFEAADGLIIRGTLLLPLTSGADPGVILLHMLGDDRTVWGEVGLAADLVAAGYAVLVVDMRGHGETGGAADWTLAADDLSRVWDAFVALDSVDDARTAVIGASIGANMALRLGVDRPDIRAVVALSPGLDYRGVSTAELPAAYGDRPLLLVASEDDAYSADSVRALAESAANARVEVYATAGHGTNMFAAAPELTPLIIDWLDEQLPPPQQRTP